MKLVVTVDTEGDNQWAFGGPISTKNARFLPPFQALCRRYGMRPTYLVTSEIALDLDSVSMLLPWARAGEAEIGAHLHPWTTAPYEDKPGLRANDGSHAFPSELESHLLRAKLENLTTQISEAFGRRPTAFRAGRYGLDGKCIPILEDLGYLVDSSVTPGLSWWRTRGGTPTSRGPSFIGASVAPYRLSPTDVTVDAESAGKLWEIPLTILHSDLLLMRSRRVRMWIGNMNGSLLSHAAKRVWPASQPQWLRPSPRMTVRRLVSVWESAQQRGLPFAVMMLHSSELMPGGSPYWRTQGSVDRLMSQLAGFFSVLRERGAASCTLSEAGAAMDSLSIQQ